MTIRRFRSIIISTLMLSLAVATAASADTRGKVRHVGTYGSGTMFVVLDKLIEGPGCVSERFQLPKTHPQLTKWLATAQLAFASDASVTVYANGCFTDEYGAINPTMTETGGWFHLSR